MEYVKLGNTGLDVSPICLGCMSFGIAEGWVHNQAKPALGWETKIENEINTLKGEEKRIFIVENRRRTNDDNRGRNAFCQRRSRPAFTGADWSID